MTDDVASMLVGDDGFVPKERYVSRAFLDLEMERLWPRVWQVACREEQVAEPGQFVEYTIGDQSVLVVRTEDGRIRAHHNACLHRGTRLATGCGHFDDGNIRCRYHAWRYALDGRLIEVVDAERVRSDAGGLEPRFGAGRVLGRIRLRQPRSRRRAAGSTSSSRFLGSCRRTTSSELRFRAYQTTILPANWKVVVDAFNEAYHVQGTHPQLLPWTDDVSIAYEQLGIHAHYGRLPEARRELRPSPRLGLQPGEYDEGEILDWARRWPRPALPPRRAGHRGRAAVVAAASQASRCSRSSSAAGGSCSHRGASTCRTSRSSR